MNTTRLLSTLAAAAALTGGIGFAYAQTTYDSAKPATSTTTETTPMQAPMQAPMQTTTPSSGTTMPATTDNMTTTPEPAPKADRG